MSDLTPESEALLKLMPDDGLTHESEALLREYLEFGRMGLRMSQTQLLEHVVAIEAAARAPLLARIEAAEADADRLAAEVRSLAAFGVDDFYNHLAAIEAAAAARATSALREEVERLERELQRCEEGPYG